MFITLYFIVTRLPDSLRSVRDHFLSLDPTVLTVDLLEQHLLAAETSVVAVGAAHGTPRTPFFEGCSPSPLAPSYASAAAVDVLGAEDVGAASASAKSRSNKGKGGRGDGGGNGGSGGGSNGGGGGSVGGGGSGSSDGSGGFGGGGGGSGGGGGRSGCGSGGGRAGATQHGGSGSGQRKQQQCRSETLSPQQLREWFSQRGASKGSGSCPYVICTGDCAGQTCGKLHTQLRCFSRLDDAWRAEFGDEAERPRWADLLRIEAAPLGASESALPGTAPAAALHTFTLDSSASRCFFRDSTTLTPLPAPVRVRLADPSGGPVLARSSTVLPCPAVPSGSLSGLHLPSFSTNLVSTAALQDVMVTTTTPGGQRVSICTCTRTGRHQATFTRRRGSSLYTLATEPPQCAAPHSSSFPPMTAPLQTLHMDVWGPARITGQGCERYFLLVVDDYTRYTTVFPLRSKGGEFSSDLLRDFCRGEGILQSFTLPASPERCIGLVMEVAHTSMVQTAAPHFLWPFAVRYAAHQLNLWPRVSLPETSPTLRWTGKVGDASAFRDVTFGELVFFYHLFPYRSAPLPPPPLFFAPGPPPVDPLPPQGPAPSDSGATRGVASGGAEPGGAETGGAKPGGAETGGAETGGAEPGGVEPGDAVPAGAESGRARPGELGGAEPAGAESGGAEPRGSASSGGPGSVSPRLFPRPEPLSSQQLCEWFTRRTCLRSGAAGAGGSAAGDAGARGTRNTGVSAGARGPGGAGPTGPGGARTGGTGGVGTGGAGGARAGGAGAGAAGVGVGGAGASAAGGTGAAGAGGSASVGAGGAGPGGAGAGCGDTGRLRPYLVPLLQQVLGLLSSPRLPPPFLCPPPDQSQPPLQPASPLPAPSTYTEQSGGLSERREPESRPALPVRTAPRVPPPHPPPVPGTHFMALRPYSVPLHVTLLAPPESSLPASTGASALIAELVDFAAACRLDYASALVAESQSAGPPFVGGESALGPDVLEDRQEDFECLAAAVPRFASMLLAPEGDPDAPDIPTPRSYIEAITIPHSSQWQAAMDVEMAPWKSTGTFVNAVHPSRVNIVDGMWIFRVKQPPGSPPAFKACYVGRGFSQRLGVDYFHTFSPTPKMTTLRVLLHVAAQRDYKLHSLDFSTAFLQGSLHEEIWLLRPPGFTGSFRAGTQWSLWRPVYSLRQAPREWHDTMRTTLAALGFTPSTADPSLLLCTDTTLPPFYVLVYIDNLVLQRFGFQFSLTQPTPLSTSHSLSAPPSNESVEPSGPHPELVGCLLYLMTCTRPGLAVLRYLCNTLGMGLVLGGRGPVVLTGHADASWVDDLATQRSSQGYTFSLGSGSVSLRSTHSSSVLSSSCEAEIYAGVMAAQELHWLTYLLTDLGEQPRSPPVLYVDNKAMIALCQEHKPEHQTKHIALRYFLARELQQRGQLRLAYVATRANIAVIFTKALSPSDHQRFSTV
ncbi:unnamed protein product [Closterium sp. NIES-54]